MRTSVPDVSDASPLCGSVASADVIALACQKDHQAFEVLYEEYKKPLERYLARLVKNTEVASDLCQDTFMHAWKYIAQQEHISQQFAVRFEAWFYRVAKNLAIDYIRHNRRYEFLPLTDSEPDEPKGVAYVVDLSVPGHEELVCELLHTKEALAKMSPQYRTCLLLHAERGLSHHEIAATLGISEKTVSANISRGVMQVRLFYDEQLGDDICYLTYFWQPIIIERCIKLRCWIIVLARSSGPANPHK